MHDTNCLWNLARRCRDLGKMAIEPEIGEQLTIWATELAEIAENSESGPVEHQRLNDLSQTRQGGAAGKGAQCEAEIDRSTMPSSAAA
jgi:hypothetical protein